MKWGKWQSFCTSIQKKFKEAPHESQKPNTTIQFLADPSKFNTTSQMAPLFLLFLLHVTTLSAADLRPGFYSETCPEAEFIVRDVMKKALIREPRSVASVMRFQFHDCFVNGCDASMLLDDTPTMLGEKFALSNINSLRSYEVVDDVKEALESVCPGIVSCADIIIMASRDAVALTGGPYWEVRLGRLDSLSASQEDSNNIMPSPRSNASYLIDLFQKYSLSVKDLVALSGSHSIGQGRCFSIMFRLYNQSGSGQPDPAIEPKFREKLDKLCPLNVDQNVTGDLDATPQVFDNQYFKDLVAGRGFLNSDQTLFTFPHTKKFVKLYSKDQGEFFKDFVEGMLKMGDLQSGRPGEVRKNCRVVTGHQANSFWELTKEREENYKVIKSTTRFCC
ncbi:Peroxidase [Quillaja saponaria]|uniref:Peroxidase n=1 Tax=Quillaja saponaria TaxID=32244 RepID=A0AAD7KTQ5_QUISA|nr:Peroxidase [Quillaja saponaria]